MRSIILFSVLLSACTSDDIAPIADADPSAEAQTSAKVLVATDMTAEAQDAESLCNGGDWCLYGAFSPTTAWGPSKGHFDPLMGDIVEFAVSFEADVSDEFVMADPLVFTLYDMKVSDVVMLSHTPALTDIIAADADSYNSGISLWYNWYTNQTSSVPAIVYGDTFGFELHDPSDATISYTPNALPEDYPRLAEGKGDGIGVLRAFDPGTWNMVDYVTGESFYYLKKM